MRIDSSSHPLHGYERCITTIFMYLVGGLFIMRVRSYQLKSTPYQRGVTCCSECINRYRIRLTYVHVVHFLETRGCVLIHHLVHSMDRNDLSPPSLHPWAEQGARGFIPGLTRVHDRHKQKENSIGGPWCMSIVIWKANTGDICPKKLPRTIKLG